MVQLSSTDSPARDHRLFRKTMKNNIFIIQSQAVEQHEAEVHCYSTEFQEARETLEGIANYDLKKTLGMNPNDHMDSPLRDTIPVKNISQGLTIRYRVSDETTGALSDRIIDMIKIEKVKDFYIIPRKIQTVVKSYKIVETSPVSDSNSIEEYTFKKKEEESTDSEDE